MPFKAAVELGMAYCAVQLVRSIRSTAKTRHSADLGLSPEAVAQRRTYDTALLVCVLADAALALVGTFADPPRMSTHSGGVFPDTLGHVGVFHRFARAVQSARR